MKYLIEIFGVDGDNAMYEVPARNCHVARRIAVQWWRAETRGQPVFAISTDGAYVELM